MLISDPNNIIEACAKIAEAHKGAGQRARVAKGLKLSMFQSEESLAAIRDEERGEDIASEIIAAEIRKLKS